MLALAEAVYSRHLRRRRDRFGAAPVSLDVPVISVGNLTLGGTGKTPAVQWLARALQSEFGEIGIVARGYRGTAQGVSVVADGEKILLDARVAGDEPVLHATSLPGSVVVIGRDRLAAARRAVELGAKLLVLDDAFSYWSIARDFDLVLVDARRPFDNGHLLPRGRLREEPSQLRRASAVLLTRCDLTSAEQLASTAAAVRANTDAPLFRSRHAPQTLRRVGETAGPASHSPDSLDCLRDAAVGSLSALADNDAFADSLEKLGAKVVAREARRDHHAWSEAEVEKTLAQFARAGARFAVTTTKDAVKLPSREWPLPLMALEIGLEIENETALLELVRTSLMRESTVEIDRTPAADTL